MGSNQGNYSNEINTAVQQANLPKSPLAQNMSNSFGQNFNNIFSQMANGAGMGNAFPGFQSGYSTPGWIQNQANSNTNPLSSNPSNPQQTPLTPPTPNSPPTGGIRNFGGPAQMDTMMGNPNGISGLSYGGPSIDNSGNPTGGQQLVAPNQLSGMSANIDPSGMSQGNIPLRQNTLFGQLPQTSLANPTLQAMNMQGMDPNALNTLMQQLQGPSVNNYNPSQQALGIPGLSAALQNSLGNTLGNQAPGQVNAVNANVAQASLPSQQQYNPQSDPYFQAVQQSLLNQQNLDQKNLQAQFGASGGSGGMGSGAAFAQAQLMAQQAPEMQAALGNYLQNQQSNFLNQQGLQQQGLLQNAQMANAANLQNSQLGTQANFQNAANQLQAGGLNNQNLSSVGNLLATLSGQAGNQNLGQQQLGSQNFFNAAGQNSQNANNILQNQLGFQTNQNGANNNLNNILASLGQFNAGQTNNQNQTYSQMLQTANQNQINNQFQGVQNLAQLMGQFGLSGIPGGSANVSLGGNSQSWLQSLLGAL